jgi:hypothetical protein
LWSADFGESLGIGTGMAGIQTEMNAKHALGFLMVGVLMKSLPAFAPDWFPGTGPDGSSASAIWLTCLGRIEILLGSYYLVKHQTLLGLKRLAIGGPPHSRGGGGVSLATARASGFKAVRLG